MIGIVREARRSRDSSLSFHEADVILSALAPVTHEACRSSRGIRFQLVDRATVHVCPNVRLAKTNVSYRSRWRHCLSVGEPMVCKRFAHPFGGKISAGRLIGDATYSTTTTDRNVDLAFGAYILHDFRLRISGGPCGIFVVTKR